MNIEITVPAHPAAIAEGDFQIGVKLYGFSYACKHIAGELAVRNVSGQKYTSTRAKWQAKVNYDAVKKWFAEQVANLGGEYHDAHNRLYAEELVA